MNTFSKLAAVAALAMGAVGAQAGVIDDFSVGQALISDVTTGDGGVWAAQAVDAGILGGFRDLYIQKNGDLIDDGNAGVRAFVGGGALSYSQDTFQSGFGLVRWDGIATGGGVDVDGLGGLDLSANLAIRITVLNADLGFPLTLNVYTDETNTNTYVANSQAVLALAGPGVYDFNFAAFAGANFSDVGAVELFLNNGTVNDLDIRIDIIETVPEPTSLALVGLALLGLGVARRKFARK